MTNFILKLQKINILQVQCTVTYRGNKHLLRSKDYQKGGRRATKGKQPRRQAVECTLNGNAEVREAEKVMWIRFRIFEGLPLKSRGFHLGLPLTCPCNRCRFCCPYARLLHSRFAVRSLPSPPPPDLPEHFIHWLPLRRPLLRSPTFS